MPRAERRAQLLETAREIIRGGGIGALTMSALSERSGASKPVVYEHFANSEAVALALLAEHFEKSTRHAIARIIDPETIYDYLDMMIDAMFDFYHAENPLVHSITNGFSSSSDVNAFYLKRQQRVHDVYRDLLLQQGVSDHAAHMGAFALMELIGSTALQFVHSDNPADRDILKRLVRGMVQGILPERGAKPSVPRSLLETISGEH